MTKSFYSELTDELGQLLAAKNDIAKREREIKDILISHGAAEVDGDLFRATIAETVRETLDAAKVRAILTPAQIARCTKRTPMATVRVSSRKAS